MPEMSPDKKLLEHLKPFGIGNYRSIMGLLWELFPLPHSITDSTMRHYNEKVDHFLSDLEANGFIKVKEAQSGGKIVAIQSKGMEYINQKENNTFHTTVTGPNAQIAIQSPSSLLNRSETDFINPIIHNISNKKAKKPIINRIIEPMSWLAGIIVCLITVWQVFFPHIFSSTPIKSAKDSSIHILPIDSLKPIKKHAILKGRKKSSGSKNSPSDTPSIPPISQPFDISNFKGAQKASSLTDSLMTDYYKRADGKMGMAFPLQIPPPQRHFTPNDIDLIINSMPNNRYRINLVYKKNDPESEIFATELSNELTANKKIDSVYLFTTEWIFKPLQFGGNLYDNQLSVHNSQIEIVLKKDNCIEVTVFPAKN